MGKVLAISSHVVRGAVGLAVPDDVLAAVAPDAGDLELTRAGGRADREPVGRRPAAARHDRDHDDGHDDPHEREDADPLRAHGHADAELSIRHTSPAFVTPRGRPGG